MQRIEALFARVSRKWKAALCAATLLLLNVYVVWELFGVEYSRYTGSIESSYIAISRYVLDHGFGLGWFPLWYGGIPYQDSYPPLLSLVTAGVSAVLKTSPASSYHIVTAATYCLGCLALFWFAYRLSARLSYSFLAGLLYSTISPASFLIGAVRGDAGGVWNPRRLQVLVAYGEGPHLLSLALLPLAILALHRALSKRNAVWCTMTAIAMAATVMANWIGAVTLAFSVLCYLMCARASRKDWFVTAGIGAFSYLLVCPWIPPSTLAIIRRNAEHIGGNFPMTMGHLLAWLPCLLGALVLWWALLWLRASRELTFSILFFWFTGYMTIAWFWGEIYLLPQPHRYQIEMEMAAVLVLAFGLKALLGTDPGRTLRYAVAVICLLLCARGLVRYRKSAQGIDQGIDVRSTSEYRMSEWVSRNAQGKRVFMPGSASFWMNIFGDTPQLGGGFDQGITNPFVFDVIYQVYSGMNAGGRESEIAIAWLDAFGVRFVGVTGPGSSEPFQPFKNPHKFDNVLPVVWRDGGDVIYEVPTRSTSVAHVIQSGDAVARRPENAIDTAAAQRYVKALEDPTLPIADFVWLDTHHAIVNADMRTSHLLSVQISYHPGWHAAVAGQVRHTAPDGLGLLLVEPQCEGKCTIALTYDGGTEMKIVQIASSCAWVGGIAWVVWWAVRRRRQPK